MAKAGAGAYSQLQRVGNYIAPQVNKAADRLNQQGMQQKQLRADDKKEQQRRQDTAKTESQRRQDEFNKLGAANVGDFVLDEGLTGFDTIDKANQHLAKTGIALVEKWSNEQRGTVAGSSEWWALQDKKNAMGGDFKTIKGDQSRLTEIHKSNLADANNGDIDDPDYETFWEGFEKLNVVPYYGEDGGRYADVYERDQQGNVLKGEDGKPLPPITKKWTNIIKGIDTPYKVVHLTDTQDPEGNKRTGLVNQFLGSMGKRTKDKVTGDFTINEQTWDDTAEKQFMGLVKGLQSNDRKMYSLLRQATVNDKVQSTKKTGFTPADKKRVEDFLRDAVKGGYGEVTTKKVTSQTNTQRKQAATTAHTRAKALLKWKRDNPTTKDDGEIDIEEENRRGSTVAYDIAKEIGQTKLNDKSVRTIANKYGLNFSEDWNVGNTTWNEFDIDGVEVDQTNTHEVAAAIANNMGFDYDLEYMNTKSATGKSTTESKGKVR